MKTPMEIMRERFCGIFKDYTDRRISHVVVVCESTVYRFRNGETDSYRIAKWMAGNFKGEYEKLYTDCLEYRHEGKVEIINGITRHPKKKPKAPYMRLEATDIRALIANTLPVINPQPEVHWS